MGLYCPSGKIAFMPNSPVEPGPVGFLSQSGGNAGDVIFAAAPRGIRFSKIVSYGNAADLNECELLEYLAEDPETEIVIAYIEGVRDGRRFFHALRRASARKPVVVLKGGRTEAGERAVFSHTASLAGSARVFDAVLRQAGAVRVDSLDELVDMAVAFRFIGPPAGGAWGGGPGGSQRLRRRRGERGGTGPPRPVACRAGGTPPVYAGRRHQRAQPGGHQHHHGASQADRHPPHRGERPRGGRSALPHRLRLGRLAPRRPAGPAASLRPGDGGEGNGRFHPMRAKEASAVPVMLVARSALDAGASASACSSRSIAGAKEKWASSPPSRGRCNAIAKMVRWREMRQDT
jgi:hypothetical protein